MVDYDFDFLVGVLGMAGVYFVCTAALWTKPRHQLEEYFGVYQGGLRNLRAAVFRKHQTILGGVVLLVAILLHQFRDLLANHESRSLLKACPWPAFVAVWLLSIATLCVVLGVSIRRFSQWQFRRIIQDILKEHRWPFAKNTELTLEIGNLLGVRRKEDDTIETYIARLRKDLNLPADLGNEPTTASIPVDDDA